MQLKKENNVVTFLLEKNLTTDNIQSFPVFTDDIQGCSCIVVDFQGVEDIDAEGIRFLVYLYLFSKSNNNTNFVENASDRVKNVLTFLSMEKLFPIF